MHLIILWLYYPSLSTTPVPDCPVTCGEYNQPQVTSTVNCMAMCSMLRVFFFLLCFLSEIGSQLMPMRFFLLRVQLLQRVSAQLSASIAHLKTDTIISRRGNPTCLPSWFIVKCLLGLFCCLRSLHFGSTQKLHPLQLTLSLTNHSPVSTNTLITYINMSYNII